MVASPGGRNRPARGSKRTPSAASTPGGRRLPTRRSPPATARPPSTAATDGQQYRAQRVADAARVTRVRHRQQEFPQARAPGGRQQAGGRPRELLQSRTDQG